MKTPEPTMEAGLVTTGMVLAMPEGRGYVIATNLLPGPSETGVIITYVVADITHKWGGPKTQKFEVLREAF